MTNKGQNIDAFDEIITYICNLSMSSGVVPSKLKIARIVCLYKEGNRNNCSK